MKTIIFCIFMFMSSLIYSQVDLPDYTVLCNQLTPESTWRAIQRDIYFSNYQYRIYQRPAPVYSVEKYRAPKSFDVEQFSVERVVNLDRLLYHDNRE